MIMAEKIAENGEFFVSAHFQRHHRVQNVSISRQAWFQICEIRTFSPYYESLKFCGGAAGLRAGQKKSIKTALLL